MTPLSDILPTTSLEQVAMGFRFAEVPPWHPDDFFYFIDLFSNLPYRIVPYQKPWKIRDTLAGNGTTFDLQGRLLNWEGSGRCLTRTEHDSAARP